MKKDLFTQYFTADRGRCVQSFFRVRFVANSEVVLVSKEVNAHNNRLGEVVVTSNS